MGRLLVSIVLLLAACAAAAGDVDRPGVIEIPAGPFVAGSDRAEREHAYRLDERGYGHSLTRQQQWYEGERDRQTVELPAYEITTTLVTNAEYARFVAASGYPAPGVDSPTWQGYGLIHPFERTRRHAWAGGVPPAGRADHPVVLVSHGDALSYAAWLSLESGESWRLPTELEWEKAARGTDGRWFPWGNDWDPMRLNSADRGPSTRWPWDLSRTAPARSACSIPLARCSSGPRPRRTRGASWSKAAPGMTGAAASAVPPRAMPAPGTSSTS